MSKRAVLTRREKKTAPQGTKREPAVLAGVTAGKEKKKRAERTVHVASRGQPKQKKVLEKKGEAYS